MFVFGFSRGASIARQLAVLVDEQGVDGEAVPITFLGCWDTVVASGAPEVRPGKQPSCTEMGEDGRIAPNVELAWHLVSLDEPRKAFRPTLMGQEERVHEAWFAGVHSDVGGSYLDHALADVTLLFMRDCARSSGARFLDAEEIDYDNLGGDVQITLEDVAPTPDQVNGLLHDSDYTNEDGELTPASTRPARSTSTTTARSPASTATTTTAPRPPGPPRSVTA